jgi:hypothetical protein
LQVDNDGADVAGLIPVELVELFQRGGSGQLDGVENELSRTMAYIVVLLIFSVFLRVADRRVNVARKRSGL